MRGADTYTESLFTIRKLDDFVPSQHPLRPIRQMVNEALKEIEEIVLRHKAELVSVDHPTTTLEELFLRIVRESELHPGRRRVVDMVKGDRADDKLATPASKS